MQAGENTSPLQPTRAAFVRGLPLSMPVEEVIERAREAGLALKPSDIHAARYYMRQAANTESPSRAPFTPSIARNAPASRTVAKQESQAAKELAATLIPSRPVDAGGAVGTDSAAKRSTVRRRARISEETSKADEVELHRLIVRLGADRAREIIQKLEVTGRKVAAER